MMLNVSMLREVLRISWKARVEVRPPLNCLIFPWALTYPYSNSNFGVHWTCSNSLKDFSRDRDDRCRDVRPNKVWISRHARYPYIAPMFCLSRRWDNSCDLWWYFEVDLVASSWMVPVIWVRFFCVWAIFFLCVWYEYQTLKYPLSNIERFKAQEYVRE